MAQTEKFTFRGSHQLKEKWTEACDGLKTPANTVFLSLVEFFLSLDEDARSELVRKPLAVKVTAGKGRR